ncbi:MAG: antibiotic biosynthesis monooxygenase [Methanocalculaceae archaeon]|jgi:heme-degrading monooxygenase HmoA|nr:antibiotic biosynthesis monooxygenase [Methanocalculaceae archaeon]
MTEVIVLFEVTVQEGKMDEYLSMAASLREELAKADGFISAERFSSVSTNGRLLSKSVWRDEESVAKWRNLAGHRRCQSHGRLHDFADYTITVVTPLRCYTMRSREHAPEDSNTFFCV